MDWSILISAIALAVSLWNTIERWISKQPHIFISNVFVEIFNHQTLPESYVRLDLTLNTLSSEPIPLSQASVSMGRAQPCSCMLRSPTLNVLDHCIGSACKRNRQLDSLFACETKFPTTLPPSSVHHICLWLHLHEQDELLYLLQQALAADLTASAEPSTGHTGQSLSSFPHSGSTLASAQTHQVQFLFQSGNRTLAASFPVDMRCCAPLDL